MLDGEQPAQLVLGAEVLTGPRIGPAKGLVAFAGGVGTADCRAQAVKRGIPVAVVPPVEEPRVWNRHWEKTLGKPPGPAMYVGRGSPLGNPWPLELAPGERRVDAAPANLRRYAAWLLVHLNDSAVAQALESITPGHYLVCSCWPAHCHAEVIVRAWRHVRGIPKGGYG